MSTSEDSGIIQLAPEPPEDKGQTIFDEPTPAASAGGNEPPKGPPLTVASGGEDDPDRRDENDGSSMSGVLLPGDTAVAPPDESFFDPASLAAEAATVAEAPAEPLAFVPEEPMMSGLGNTLVMAACVGMIFATGVGLFVTINGLAGYPVTLF